jgi:uncharacterized protein
MRASCIGAPAACSVPVPVPVPVPENRVERLARSSILRFLLLTLVLLVGVLTASSGLAAAEVPPRPTARVTDTVGVLSPAARDVLERRLAAYQERSGHQIVVWIGSSLEGMTIEEFAVRAFEQWGVGRKGEDDGIALFIFARDRAIRIEVGYGLEDRVTDLVSSRIIREIMQPRLQAGDFDGAVQGAVEGLAGAIEGRPGALPHVRGPPVRGPSQEVEMTPGKIVGYAILGILLLVLFVTNPRLALWLLFSLAHRGGGGGGFSGGGGGGFGGGRSGGGGATGGW